MDSQNAAVPAPPDSSAINHDFYNKLWSGAHLVSAEKFNTWPMVASLLPKGAARLEVGPGLRPRLPVAGTNFVDISPVVVERLNGQGGKAAVGEISALPFADESQDLVCAFDVVEHVEDHLRCFAELSRVLKPDGSLILSVPLHARLWTGFDEFVGHVRRYEPAALAAILDAHGLVPVKSAAYGMQSNNRLVLEIGVWALTHFRSGAMFWFNLFFPVALRCQKPLRFEPGLVVADDVAEIVLVCRRAPLPASRGEESL